MKKLFLPSRILLLLFCNELYANAPSEACVYSGANQISTSSLIINAIPYRSQWNENNGYCGETSILSAGLYYGEYVSQYDARVLANINFPTKIMQLNQILIGSPGEKDVSNNIAYAASNMHLTYQIYNNLPLPGPSSVAFLTWVKGMVINHYPTIIGVYENASVFDQPSPDPEYDHIVPVFGIQSSHPLNEIPVTAYPDDNFFLHDNELYTYTGLPNVGCYEYEAGNFQQSRSGANQPPSATVGIYSVSNNSNGLGNYGIAITGVKGKGLLPVSIQTTPNQENPAIQDQNTRPMPELITLNILVSNLIPNTPYILLKYTSFNALPADDDFTKSYGNASAKCSIQISSGTTFLIQEIVYSNTMAIYRAVLANDPRNLPLPC